LAIDGDTDGDFYEGGSVSCTPNMSNPSWEGLLERLAIITKISVYNRTGDKLGKSTKGFYLDIYRDGKEQKVFHFKDTSDTVENRYDIYPNIAGSKVKIGLSGKTYLNLAEVEVFGYTLQE